jgi:hypothetical protein
MVNEEADMAQDLIMMGYFQGEQRSFIRNGFVEALRLVTPKSMARRAR